jgi:quercetin dioxygenase-like cupin family protein
MLEEPMPKKKKETTVPVGRKIKKARTAKKISLDMLANETGYSIEYLKEIEGGEKPPHVGTILQISRALKIDSGLLLEEEQSNLKKRIKEYSKRTENYAYTTLTPGAENKHLKAFKVVVEPEKDHKGVGYNHEGEEFVYVLSGGVEVTVGEHVNTLKEGDSLHFNSAIPHKLKNTMDKKAELLVVIYGP